ncbi:MAG: YitT family protein [candidate division KSB1 bacterium]|nr:YitT family protein [candidate division KSB1 bacterium]MDZ7392684.1 YitT family protein [candidate division KSB1 bacterium]
MNTTLRRGTWLRLRALRDYLWITVGSFIMALGIGVFLVDAHVVPGGVSGLSMTIHYLSGGAIPVGALMWVLNVPLYIWGVRQLGPQFGARTFYGFTTNSLFIDFVRGAIPGLGGLRLQQSAAIRSLQEHDFLFLVLCGGVLLGIGLGIIFKFKGSTAGSDIVAAVLQKNHGVKPGQAIMLIDFAVISLAGAVIHWRGLAVTKPVLVLTLYAFFLLFVSSRLIDVILDGMDYARSALIVSNKSDQVAEAIMNDLSRGATALKGRGLYTGQDREILYTVVSRKEINQLIELVKAIDPHCFMIINNVHEVLGEGFKRRV